MSKLPPPWDYYLNVQAKLRKSTTVDDSSWGLEAALDRLLAAGATASPEAIERTARSESRRERHRARLRRQHRPREEEAVDGKAQVRARQHLRIIKGSVSEDDWMLLRDLGAGCSYHEIAATAGTSTGALRVRVHRLRDEFVPARAA
jgi:DNA-binding NarL/FixJ family response regulator